MKIQRLIAALLLGAGLTLAGGTAFAGDPERGESMAGTCAGCHGSGGHSNNPSMFPTIAGMDEDQMVELLQAYRDGDKQDAMMNGQAANLSDQDMRDLAAYYAQQ